MSQDDDIIAMWKKSMFGKSMPRKKFIPACDARLRAMASQLERSQGTMYYYIDMMKSMCHMPKNELDKINDYRAKGK